MFVLEFSNNRCLIWNTIPTTNGTPADVVVGQRDFTTNATALNDWQFRSPRGLWTDGTRLAIGDAGNRRVLIWNAIPETNGEPANLVVGQPDFTTRDTGATSTRIGGPNSIDSDGTNLYVVDTLYHRVMIFDFPTGERRGRTHGARPFRLREGHAQRRRRGRGRGRPDVASRVPQPDQRAHRRPPALRQRTSPTTASSCLYGLAQLDPDRVRFILTASSSPSVPSPRRARRSCSTGSRARR